MKDGTLKQYQDDYIISWDFSSKDLPCVGLAKIERDGASLKTKVLGHVFGSSGCISLRQAIEEFEARERQEEERARKRAELLRKAGDALSKNTNTAAEALKNLAEEAKK